MDMTFVDGTYCDIMTESLHNRARTGGCCQPMAGKHAPPPTSTDVGHHWATAHLTHHTTVEEPIGAVFSVVCSEAI